ncbi:MAG: hypothetical protein ACREP7_23445 [Lysobacter sp.]
MFSYEDFEEGSGIDPLFEALLCLAPDTAAFLGDFENQVRPSTWSGSLKEILEGRRSELVRLASKMPGEVAEWVQRGLPDLDRWIRGAGDMDRNQEESFE